MIRELRGEPEPSLDELIAKLDPVDLVLVEGYKYEPHPKLQVVRPSHNAEPMPDAANIVAVATDDSSNTNVVLDQVVVDLNAVGVIVDLALSIVDS